MSCNKRQSHESAKRTFHVARETARPTRRSPVWFEVIATGVTIAAVGYLLWAPCH
jgi:hypothetical protein